MIGDIWKVGQLLNTQTLRLFNMKLLKRLGKVLFPVLVLSAMWLIDTQIDGSYQDHNNGCSHRYCD